MQLRAAGPSEIQIARRGCILERKACATLDRMQGLLEEHQVQRLETDSVRGPGKRDYRNARRFELPRQTWEATERSSTHRRTLRASSRFHRRPVPPIV